jgi:hypothetical protein
MTNDDLRQADLSTLSLREMTTAQRAELRRRLDAFVRDFAGDKRPPAKQSDKNIRKWVPGMKA